MHDIDRAMFESESETGYETEYETEYESEYEFGEAEGENQELALATELLDVRTEAELDRFLGKLISGAVKAAGNFARSDAGKAVGGVLKSAAKQALPQLGQAVGLKTEGLSAEDSEYENARAYVRFANETAQRAAKAKGAPPAAAAQRAAVAAAQQHLPGLVRPGDTNGRPGGHASGGRQGGQASEGRWVRRGNRIVLFDA
jgi:hypothetical protein